MQINSSFSKKGQAMESILITYKNISRSMRNIELLEAVEDVSGSNLVISPWDLPGDSKSTLLKSKQGYFKYFSFILTAMSAIRKYKPRWVVLNNNQTAILIKCIKRFFPNIIIIYDSAELYINVKAKSLKEKLSFFMRYYEKKYLKHVDLVFAANLERAKIMQDYFSLNKLPYVFDNIHPIKDAIVPEHVSDNIKDQFRTDKFTIIYSGGISKQRQTMSIVKAVSQLDDSYKLIIVGSIENREYDRFHEFMKSYQGSNIVYLGFVSLSELRYLYSMSDVSISVYGMDTLNNKYCASGKVYESLFELTPIVTSENPPLQNLCKKFGVGVSSSDISAALQQVRSDYSFYKSNTIKFVSNFSKKARYDDLINQISDTIG